MPQEWKPYQQANAAFFDGVGSPGGANRVGRIDKDHPIVETLPLQPEPEPERA